MYYSGLNTNADRRQFWEKLAREYPPEMLDAALASINPNSAKVLIWRFREGKSLNHIKELLNRSISTVRNHQSRGMFELQRYFEGMN